MADLREELEYIIAKKQIRTVFQPILSLRDGSVLGHEALSRIACESVIASPDRLFEIAEQCNRLWDLELLCRTKALEAAYLFMIPPYSKKLFINVNPNTMYDDSFKKGFTKEFLKQYDITPQNVIFEITERNIVSDITGFKATLDHYKSQDYQIAIDDAGAGYSGLNLISDVSPNYIKMDMKLIRDVDADSLKFALVKGMVEVSRGSNIFLIAEGIETVEELETLINLGVQYGQGYFIQKPSAKVKEIRTEVLEVIKEINLRKNRTTQSIVSNIYIANLCSFTSTVCPAEKVSNVYEFFKRNPGCCELCVIDNEIPLGIVTQQKLYLKLSGLYGFTLHQNKQISELMDRSFLSVDFKTPVNIVSTLAMSRPRDQLYDFIVVTESDRYLGTVTIKDLLEKTTEIEVSAAKHQNPLTGLPGNLIIEQKLSHCVHNALKYSVAYLDIDNFKAYNDVYGFEKGDLAIKLLAEILRKNVFQEQFIGHVGGDDFVVIINDIIEANYFDKIMEEFELQVLSLYNENDIRNGYIMTANRNGLIQRFPLIKLTVVVENNEMRRFNNIYELTEKLAKLKSTVKKEKAIYSRISL